MPTGQSIVTLDYKGSPVHLSGDTLSLTDMWKAAGSDPAQSPAKWRSLPGTKAFVEHVSLTIGKSDSDLFVTVNGGRQPGTKAHWQVGLAYAKYLSPEFHMWCNSVVRNVMEGRVTSSDGLYSRIAKLEADIASIHKLMPEFVTAMREVANGHSRRITVTNFETMLEILRREGYRKRRRNLVQTCSRMCWRWLAESGLQDRRNLSSETGKRLFQIDAVRMWLKVEGAALIRGAAHAVDGQTVLQFPSQPKIRD